MSDTYRRYSAIKRAIMQFYGPNLSGHQEKHFNTLAALICGLVGGKHVHLSSCADHAPSKGVKQESVIDRFRRWLKNDQHTLAGWFLPIAKQLLLVLAKEPLQFVMDGSVVGRGCIALMVSVVYHGRALPLCWLVVRGAKGHFPEHVHRELLRQLKQLVPSDAQVVFLGDGEFDGTELQADLTLYGWQYVCRTASNIVVTSNDVVLQIADLRPPRGECVALTPAFMTTKHYGPVSILALWEAQYEEPLYLVTNLSDLDVATAMYKKRAHIETFFSDQKSRGFNIHKSHLRDPARLCRLLIASCLAYLWLVYLGVRAISKEWMRELHRTDRCDLSLFRLGFRLLSRCLKENVPIPDGFLVPAVLPTTLVRSFHKPV